MRTVNRHDAAMASRARCRTLAVASALLTLATAPGALPAQVTLEGLPPGSRVRVTLDDSLLQAPLAPRATQLIGTLVRVSGDTLFLMPPGGVMPAAVLQSSVRAADQSRGRSRVRSALRQGLAAGAVWALLGYSQPANRRQALAWGGAGLGFGMLLGAARPYEQWKRVRE